MTEDQFWLLILIAVNAVNVVVAFCLMLRARASRIAFEKWCDENPLD